MLPHLEDVARLRIQVFREWPYLYDGSMRYERSYLKHYADCPDSTVVLAMRDHEVIGASTAIPLRDADPDFKKPFEDKSYPIESIFYLGESVLLPEYRGQGIGHSFFDQREQAARASGCSLAAFCAVDRAADDPRKPSGHRPLDAFWQKRGYTRQADLKASFDWKEIDQDGESSHTLNFWLKPL